MNGKHIAQNSPSGRLSSFRMRNMRKPAKEILINDAKILICGMFSEKN
jgi:hypothetical protein